MHIPEGRPLSSLVERPEYQAAATEILRVFLCFVAPVFDRSTEEGLRFRIYRRGALEVRTTQVSNGEERVGIIYSVCDAQAGIGIISTTEIAGQERIVKASEHVESIFEECEKAERRRYYLVLRTEGGHEIVTERLQNGKITWDVNPDRLLERNSLAKIVRSKNCESGVCVRDLLRRVDLATQDSYKSPSTRKLWAHSTFARVVGAARVGAKTKRELDPVLAAKKLSLRA